MSDGITRKRRVKVTYRKGRVKNRYNEWNGHGRVKMLKEKKSGRNSGEKSEKWVGGGSSIFISYLPLGSSDARKIAAGVLDHSISPVLPLILYSFFLSHSPTAGLFRVTLFSLWYMEKVFPANNAHLLQAVHTRPIEPLLYCTYFTHTHIPRLFCSRMHPDIFLSVDALMTFYA